MQNRQRCSRLSLVHADHAGVPRPYHWALNALGTFFIAAPFLFSFLSWFLLVWCIDFLQSRFSVAGPIHALLDVLQFGTSVFELGLFQQFWSCRAGWCEEVCAILDQCCEDIRRIHKL
jgi:hypothetical protein